MGVPPGKSTFQVLKRQKTKPETHKFELPSATSKILAICKNPNRCGLENAKSQEVVQPTNVQIELKTNDTDKSHIYIYIYIYIYICIYVYLYFIYTHLHSHFGSPCAHMCIHMRIRTNFPPDAIEVGCTVPTSGPLPRQPKSTLGFHVILFVDTACFQTTFPKSFPKPFWKRILETVFLTGITTENKVFQRESR